MNWTNNPTHEQAHVAFTKDVRKEVTKRRKIRTPKDEARAEYDTLQRNTASMCARMALASAGDMLSSVHSRVPRT